ncbi:Bug family tripartite tricarboxylate transporter substrate binding protein [Bradyrhizobium erythrophlei]|uniref:Tripartite-type tricarboxylate transporter, receptor component TctC n=1 Tax=Bradyrhizobium erythrophlei TaxID=1437360 RepID=A0A1M5JWV4_9BRAD|nr:tripartite tricarboxylate transporter substrate binding protein [Bradyrhizobium erythrophlei]SHG45024.1 Tripartite-type tricarboxylate transporter, receptor component TctC [Bradyrhizobium erythrophlei]
MDLIKKPWFLVRIVLGCATLIAVPASGLAQTSQYPDRPIRMIVPFAAGSVTDILARTVAQHLAPRLHGTVVVENKPGAGGNVGAAFVAEAAPDGYTLLMGSVSTNAINPSLYKDLTFDPLRDFAPITGAASVTNVLVVPDSVPARNVDDLLALMKKDSYSYASGGAGGAQHLAAAIFTSLGGAQATHVAYKGGFPALPDLLSNRVQFMFCNLPICLPYIQNGKLRALGVTSTQRSALLPDVPTMAQLGLAGCSVDGWFGLFAPSRVRPAILDTLNREVTEILRQDDVLKQLLAQGAEPIPASRDQFTAFVKNEHDKWASAVVKLGITLE